MPYSCCFTGHRDLPPDNSPAYVALYTALQAAIGELADEGCVEFIAGGARGFDLLAAALVLEEKRLRPSLRLILILPCADQPRDYPMKDRRLYQAQKLAADECIVLHESHIAGCMHERNRLMVDRAELVVSYLRVPRGGTQYTVDYARRKGKPLRAL